MSSCCVLRCPKPVGDVAISNSPLRREYAVCSEHGNAIREGAEWRPDPDQLTQDGTAAVILMGEDLEAGELTLSAYGLVTDFRSIGSSDEAVHKLTLKGKRGQQEEEFTLRMSKAQLGRLAEFLAGHDRP